jgi:hypothetical protein
MSGKYDLAYKKLDDGKNTLAQARDDNALTVALLSIHGAIDEWREASGQPVQPYSPGFRRPAGKGTKPSLSDKLYQLQKDGIIGVENRNHVLKMRNLRNMAAHGDDYFAKYRDIEHYAELVGRILVEDSHRKRMAGKGTKKATGNLRSPAPKARQQPVASPPIPEVRPQEPPRRTVPQQRELGSNESARPAVEPVLSPQDSSQKAETDEELLRRLLSTP